LLFFPEVPVVLVVPVVTVRHCCQAVSDRVKWPNCRRRCPAGNRPALPADRRSIMGRPRFRRAGAG
jgi:hypothetical protein